MRRLDGIYPGESITKSVVRLYVYKLVKDLGIKLGDAIALAGTEPKNEVELLRDYLGWPAHRTWIVDWAKETKSRQRTLDALASIKTLWPAVNVLHADVNNVITQLDTIGFASLDFMGHLTRDCVQPCLKQTIPKLAKSGVLALTWFRGHEKTGDNQSVSDVFAAAKRVGVTERNPARWAGVLTLMREWSELAGVNLRVIGAQEYQHDRHGAMSVTVWQRV